MTKFPHFYDVFGTQTVGQLIQKKYFQNVRLYKAVIRLFKGLNFPKIDLSPFNTFQDPADTLDNNESSYDLLTASVFLVASINFLFVLNL